MAFDPYGELLGIPPGARPPPPEELLELAPGESDETAILAAGVRQNDRLRAYAIGNWADVATQLQREVSQAVSDLMSRAEAAAVPAPSPSAHKPPLPPAVSSPVALERAGPAVGEPAHARFLLPEEAAPSAAPVQPGAMAASQRTAHVPALRRLDSLLKAAAGQDNDIVHLFLRFCCVALLAAVVGLVIAAGLHLTRPGAPQMASETAPMPDDDVLDQQDGRRPPLAPPPRPPPQPPVASAGKPEAEERTEPAAAKPEVRGSAAGKPTPTTETGSLPVEPVEKPPARSTPAPDPLSEFPQAVELPPLGKFASGTSAQGATVLGSIRAPPDTPCAVELLGKDMVPLKEGKLVFEPTETGDREPGWVVGIEGLGNAEKRVEVARFSRNPQGGLMFQWAERAAEFNGDYLRNCALGIRVGEQSRVVALRESKRVRPMILDLTKRSFSHAVPIPFLPPNAPILVEFTRVEGFAGFAFQPTGPAKVKNQVQLVFSRKNVRNQELAGATFDLAQTLGGNAVYIRMGNQTVVSLRNIVSAAAPRRQWLNVEAGRLRAQLDYSKRGERIYGRAGIPIETGAITDELDRVEFMLWCVDFYEKVNKTAQLHFRVLWEVNEQMRIELVRSEAPPTSVAQPPVPAQK
jgi:hypothetical protein